MKWLKNINLLCCMVIMVISLGACEQLVKPRPYGMGETPEGSEYFQRGWEDGCESGMSVYGNARYRAAYSFKQDLSLIDNGEYYRAWRDAWTYCRWYTFTWVRNF